MNYKTTLSMLCYLMPNANLKASQYVVLIARSRRPWLVWLLAVWCLEVLSPHPLCGRLRENISPAQTWREPVASAKNEFSAFPSAVIGWVVLVCLFVSAPGGRIRSSIGHAPPRAELVDLALDLVT